MKFVRIFAPFLFVRNWYSGQWEFSTLRLILFAAGLLLFFIAVAIMIILQAPVEYTSQ